ncbi:MAG TPA: S41 family peptidase [Candidatus Eisenbacteria bacterium]|nr:S41 family peptidase [Candidatus Eisenbacteria bacterium]
MSFSRLRLVVIFLIIFFAGYYLGTQKVILDWKHYKPNITVVNKEPPSSASLVDFGLFWNVWNKLTSNYYDQKAVDPQKMLYGAISGMVSAVGDPYTMFLPPVAQSNFQQQMAGQFTGIGAELGLKDSKIIIVAPLDGSPAQKAGVKTGDTIVGVDGKSVDGWTLPQAVEKIRGPKGTQVTITFLHKDAKTPVDITITRDVITVKSVVGWVKKAKDVEGVNLKDSKLADTSVLYIRLSQFGDNTNADLENIVKSFVPQVSDGTVKGIVLDLRNNPGGYLTDATYVAGEFLPEGTSVVMEEEASGNRTTLSVNRKGALVNSLPVVVIINKGSASASEIVSGALRDNKRAKLVGDTSFGKGTVQEALDLGGGAGLHVTIAKWLTPNGTWVGRGVNGDGLKPDVAVSLDDKDPSHDTQLEKAIQTVLQ